MCIVWMEQEQEISKLQVQLERLMAMGVDAFRQQRPFDASVSGRCIFLAASIMYALFL